MHEPPICIAHMIPKSVRLPQARANNLEYLRIFCKIEHLHVVKEIEKSKNGFKTFGTHRALKNKMKKSK